MKIGIYGHETGSPVDISGVICSGLEDLGHEVSSARCLCEYNQDKLDKLEEVVICHPSKTNQNGCWDVIKKAVEKNPKIHFYVLTFFWKERERAIGKYPNLTYINERNRIEVIQGILSLDKKDISKTN